MTQEQINYDEKYNTAINESESNASPETIANELLSQNQQITDILEVRTSHEVRAALANTCRFFDKSFKELLTIEKLKHFVNSGEEKKAREELYSWRFNFRLLSYSCAAYKITLLRYGAVSFMRRRNGICCFMTKANQFRCVFS